VPFTIPTGATIRTVTFWYPAHHDGIDGGAWPAVLGLIFDDEFRPARRLLAAPSTRRRAALAAPAGARPIRCAGGRLSLLDLPATRDEAAQQAAQRYQSWSATATIRGRRPTGMEAALLGAGQDTYTSYRRLRRVVGDALVIMRSGGRLYPVGSRPRDLVEYVHEATRRLQDAAPDDVIVTIAA
jgi:hypothetical protein